MRQLHFPSEPGFSVPILKVVSAVRGSGGFQANIRQQHQNQRQKKTNADPTD
jgi:hypothetical protein